VGIAGEFEVTVGLVEKKGVGIVVEED